MRPHGLFPVGFKFWRSAGRLRLFALICGFGLMPCGFAQSDPFESNPGPATATPRAHPHAYSHPPEPETEPVGTPAPPTVSTPAPRPFSESYVRGLAARYQIPLPLGAAIVPSPAASGVPAAVAGYLGAWGGDRRWGGQGRQSMVIVTNVDSVGNAAGILALGPPNEHTYGHSAARWTLFRGRIDRDGLKFTLWGTYNYVFSVAAPTAATMFGQVDGVSPGRRPLHTSIVLERLP